MAYTLADRDALLKAIGSGVLLVSHGDSTVRYQSMDDMLKALALMEGQLAAAGLLPNGGATGGSFTRRTVSRYGSGLR
jgi:hypothetical protein